MSGGWDIAQVESLVLQSTTCSDPRQKALAISQIHALRSSPERASIGMRLFAEARNEMARSFGLTLLREYLSLSPAAQSVETRQLLRRRVCEWLSSVLAHSSHSSPAVPQHVKNQMLSIFTLCVKRDYPELWPTAFEDLLSLAQHSQSLAGVDAVIRVLNELEMEVVMFSEGRSKEEIAHNTLIKDTMRATSVMQEIVRFLCRSVLAAAAAAMQSAQAESESEREQAAQHAELGGRCLLSLAELIGWIDTQLVLSEALPTVLQFVSPSAAALPACQAGAMHCVYELAKKGMDPVAKVSLLHKTELLPRLLSMRSDFSHAQPLVEDAAHPLRKVHRQYGLALDMLCLELLGCSAKYEDALLPISAANNGKSGAFVPASKLATHAQPPQPEVTLSASVPADLAAAAPVAAALLRMAVPEMLNFLRHPYVSVATAVLPACTKLVQTLKAQKTRKEAIAALLASDRERETLFLAQPYLEPLLFSLLQQCQFPQDFRFEELDAEEEEENELLEGKREVRVLFSNCVRVYPRECLEVLVVALRSLPQPFSTAPFPPLEATLRLLSAICDSGVSLTDPQLSQELTHAVSLLLQTDVSQHAHTQVQLVFFEVAVRYAKLLSERDVVSLAGALLQRLQTLSQRRSLSAYHSGYRDKLAALTLKLSESLDRRASLLLPYCDVMQGMLETSCARGGLSAAAEVSVGVALGLTLSVSPAEDVLPAEAISQITQQQRTLLTQCVQRVFVRMNDALAVAHNAALAHNSSLEAGALVVRQLNVLSALVKNVPRARRAEFSAVCEDICVYVCNTLLPFALSQAQAVPSSGSAQSPSSSLRGKITVFLHHMLVLLGESSLGALTQSLLSLLATAELVEMESTLQLAQQLCAELETRALPALHVLWPAALARLRALMLAVDGGNGLPLPTNEEAPHVESERVMCVRLLLSLVHTLVLHRCSAVLCGSTEDVLQSLLCCLRGQTPLGRTVSYSASLPLRRTSLVVVSALLGQWMFCAAPTGASPQDQGEVVPQAVRDTFVRFLREQYVPTVFVLLGQPGQKALRESGRHLSQCVPDYAALRLQTQDAASQSVIAEIAALLFLLVRKNPQFNSSQPVAPGDDLPAYLQSLLRSMHWPDEIIGQLLAQLYNPAVSLSSFKDSMRQFARNVLV